MGRASSAKAARRAWDSPEGRVVERALWMVGSLDERHPGLRRTLADLVRRDDRPAGATWPSWCWAPSALVETVIIRSGRGPQQLAPGMAIGALAAEGISVGAISAWADGRQAWVVDGTTWDEVTSTPLEDIPPGPVLRLPAWGVYLARDIEGMRAPLPADPPAIVGLVLRLDWRAAEERPELVGIAESLRALEDDGAEIVLTPIRVPLDLRTVDECVQEAAERVRAHPGLVSDDDLAAALDLARTVARNALAGALLVSTSSEGLDIEPAPSLPPRGPVTLLAPEVSRVGWRLGAAIRAATGARGGRSPDERHGPRPHLRRAHWHRYWTGPLTGERRLELRWVAPTFVGDPDELPVTVHRGAQRLYSVRRRH